MLARREPGKRRKAAEVGCCSGQTLGSMSLRRGIRTSSCAPVITVNHLETDSDARTLFPQDMDRREGGGEGGKQERDRERKKERKKRRTALHFITVRRRGDAREDRRSVISLSQPRSQPQSDHTIMR